MPRPAEEQDMAGAASHTVALLNQTSPRPATIVSAPTRLHFGLFGLEAGAERRFHGVGLMLNQPRVVVKLHPASRFSVCGNLRNRALDIVQRWQQWIRQVRQCNSRFTDQERAIASAAGNDVQVLPPCAMRIESPANHIGLGVGTQLSLAIGKALAMYFNSPMEISDLGNALGRGRRSSVGLQGFDTGGLIVDGGHSDTGNSPGHRLEFPIDWRIAVMVPEGCASVFGHRETGSFQRLAQKSNSAWSLEHSLGAAAAIAEAATAADFDLFSERVAEFGYHAGLQFSSIQGGAYHGPVVTELVKLVRSLGFAGVGQSSWGPAVYVFAKSQGEAAELIGQVRSRIPLKFSWISSGDNNGHRATGNR